MVYHNVPESSLFNPPHEKGVNQGSYTSIMMSSPLGSSVQLAQTSLNDLPTGFQATEASLTQWYANSIQLNIFLSWTVGDIWSKATEIDFNGLAPMVPETILAVFNGLENNEKFRARLGAVSYSLNKNVKWHLINSDFYYPPRNTNCYGRG